MGQFFVNNLILPGKFGVHSLKTCFAMIFVQHLIIMPVFPKPLI